VTKKLTETNDDNRLGLNYVGEAVIDIDLSYITDSLASLAEKDPEYGYLLARAQEATNQLNELQLEIRIKLGGEITDSKGAALQRYDALDLWDDFFDQGGDRLSALDYEEYSEHSAWLLGRILYRTREAEPPDPAAFILIMSDEVLGKLWLDSNSRLDRDKGPDCLLDYVEAYIEALGHIRDGYDYEAEWSMAEVLEEPPDEDDRLADAVFQAEVQATGHMMERIMEALRDQRATMENWKQFDNLCRLRDKALYRMDQRRPGKATDPGAFETYRAWVQATQEMFSEVTDEGHSS
jgi:hypothetical protein